MLLEIGFQFRRETVPDFCNIRGALRLEDVGVNLFIIHKDVALLGLTRHLLELGDYLLFIHIRLHSGQSGSRRFEFAEVCRLRMLFPGRDKDAERLSAAGDGDGKVGFEEACDVFPEFAYAAPRPK
jgi:hypothetical protein